MNVLDEEEFEDTKGAIRIRISKKKTTQLPNEKGQKDKQRSTKHTHKTKDRVTGRLFRKRVVCAKLDIYVFINDLRHEGWQLHCATFETKFQTNKIKSI